MKQMTGRKLLGILFALAIIVGLLPGMNTAACAENGAAITVKPVEHGTVTTNIADNGTVTVTATPEAGYRLMSVKAFYAVKQDVAEAISSWRAEDWGKYFHLRADYRTTYGWHLNRVNEKVGRRV